MLFLPRRLALNIFIVDHYAIPPSLGGLVRHYYFSKYLRKEGHQVRILTASQIHNSSVNFIEDRQLIREENIDGIPYSFVRTISYSKNNWRRIFNMLEFPVNVVRAIKQLIKKGDKPDVLYISSPTPFACYTVMHFANKKKIPCIMEVRDLWPLSIINFNHFSKNNPVINILFHLEKWLYVKADQLIFTMSGGKRYIKDQGWDRKIDFNKITHINNGVDLTEFEFNKENFELDDGDLNNPDYFKIVFTGSVRHIYQLGIIVETAKLCQIALPKIRFFIYGDGPEKEYLERFAEKYQLKNIWFKGKIQKKYIASVLSKADVTLLHSKQVYLNKYGISPNKIFEYAAAKKPILSTIQEKDSIIDKYACGIQVKNQNPQEIFKAIQVLESLSKEERETMGKNAYLLAQNHDYKNLTKKLLEVIEKAV